MRSIISPLILAATLAAGTAAAAREIVVGEERVHPYAASLPLCGDPGVLGLVANRFAEKESQFWQSDLTLVAFSQIRPVAFRPWGLDTIPRRYCTASATLSDGRRQRVDYSVREDLGWLGQGWGIEFCVGGTDRNLAFAPSCRMARP